MELYDLSASVEFAAVIFKISFLYINSHFFSICNLFLRFVGSIFMLLFSIFNC